MMRLALIALLCLGATSVQAGTGLRTLEVAEPVTTTHFPAVVFYPAPAAVEEAVTRRGPYVLHAQADTAIASGRHPLVLISHGHGGSMFGHHDLAEHLARRGYIVASMEHAGDSYRDQSGTGTDRVMLGRAWQVSAVLDALLGDPAIAPHIDRDRIGVAGFSAGGYTSLLLLGARPDFSRIHGYCARHPKDPELCRFDETRFRTFTDTPPTADTRIRAAFVMSPLGVFFSADGLAPVQAPVFLYAAQRDRVLLPEENAHPVRDALPNLREFREVENAGHYVFLAPCAEAMAEELPEICVDPAGVDREAVHRRVNNDALAFFDQQLRAP